MENTILQLIFWLGIFIVFYAYLGYGLLLFFLIKIKRLFVKRPDLTQKDELPEVTFIVAAYNEANWIEQKIQNSLEFDYPKDKIHFLYVTDGCSDSTPELIRNFPFPADVQWSLHHEAARRGKIAAVERIMQYVESPISVYTDANTMVNPMAIRNIVRHYQNPKVGAVSGEKRISMSERDAANAAGEGIYWKYESTLKCWDSELYSVVGAAGELFSIRTELFESVPEDTIIEDFCMTLGIAKRGYQVRYEPQAYAVESSSASVQEELKRKIRIAAGGLQAISRLRPLLNPFRYGVLSFQYISHRVLRWTLAPLALILIFFSNVALAAQGILLYQVLLLAQVLFYTAGLLGYVLEKRQIKFKVLFIPYYFMVMNYAVFRGFGRFIKGSQSVVWERAARKIPVNADDSRNLS